MGDRKKILIFLIIVVFILGSVSLGLFLGCRHENTGQQQEKSAPANNTLRIEEKRIKEHIVKLISEDFQGRRAGTQGEAEAALYLAQELKSYGLEPLGDKGSYFQTFPIPNSSLRWEGKRLVFFHNDNGERLLSDNVVGLIKGFQRPEEYILLSAHYDHLGKWQNELYPGANDNASGVGAVLEIARALSQSKDLPCSVIIAFWGAEEMGLIGSKFFVNNPSIDPKKIKMAINLDSIGSGTENDFLLWSAGPSQVTHGLYLSWQKWEGINLTRQDNPRNTSDHEALAQAAIPAVTILSSDWLINNHTVLDNLKYINFEKITFLSQNLLEFLTSSEIVDFLDEGKNA